MNLLDYPRWPSLARESILNIPVDLRSRRVTIQGRTIDYGEDVDSVVITGMGGSGVVGDIIGDLCWFWGCGKPIIVSKGMRLPRALSKPLVIAISYSGNTAETIASAREALNRGFPTIGITTGGKLAQFLNELGAPVIIIPKASAPRYGLPALLYPALVILERFGVMNVASELESGIVGMEKAVKSLEEAQGIARRIVNTVPVIWVTESRRGVGIRFKNDLNENTKYYAIVSVIPEGAHNDIAAVMGKQQGLSHVFIYGEGDYEARYLETLMEVVKSYGKEAITVKLSGGTPLESEMFGVAFLGLVTLALAEMTGTEPVGTEPIDKLKRLLDERKVIT
ncbi:bifunctional phosphoglucose/phosphomannose isomerase [Vulcanisaeta thermophila]|uniref:bifunctional phosphoglucose/phosphomannose isomerase n=1 Tax=Vulcanisaeta thermophila TaxID=867917 RepID=UPI000852F122|nr:bifunctional phosphoglucose/phosphomannose isomerase [Vulcanisaeta thermophila]